MEIISFKYTANKYCARCIMDDSVVGIEFDKDGVCNFCHMHNELDSKYPLNENTEKELHQIIDRIKRDGRNKTYDCIVGISGGKDSSYTLVKVAELGLRPLVVHFDNGWNSETAVQNIRNICSKLNLPLHTHVADWEEFKDLQRAFLFASVPEGEVPTDYVILSVLTKMAAKEKIKYVIPGSSFRTEGTTPLSWTYQDPRYVNSIHRIFGKKKLKSFPVMSTLEFLYYSFVKNIKQFRLLYYIDYNEDQGVKYLEDNYNWNNYGGKHFESTYTKFYQSYLLTRKFDIDKRKLHYSAKIRSGQMERHEAIDKIKTDPFIGGEELILYTLKKLEISEEEFKSIMSEKPKSFLNYPSLFNLILFLRRPIILMNKLGFIPDVIIKKYYNFRFRK
jgi:N-acetyl sugar amidotransferase